jgi:hypothetical protein
MARRRTVPGGEQADGWAIFFLTLIVILLLAIAVLLVGFGGAVSWAMRRSRPSAGATTTASGESAVVTMLVEPDNACIWDPDGPYVDSFPVGGSVDSVDMSDGCTLAVVACGEILTLSGERLVPMFKGLPFDSVAGALFVGESFWWAGRVGGCWELGFFLDDVWHEIVDPEGAVTCAGTGGSIPIGASGDSAIFARYQDDGSDDWEYRGQLVVYEGGIWTDYAVLKGLAIGGTLDKFGTLWVALWSGEIARCDLDSCNYANAPGAVTSSQTAGITSDEEGNVWLLNKNALSRFDGERWTSYTSGTQYERWGEQLEEAADHVEVITLLGVDGSPLDSQPDFFGGSGQPFGIDVAKTGDTWLGVRSHLEDGGVSILSRYREASGPSTRSTMPISTRFRRWSVLAAMRCGSHTTTSSVTI